MAGTKKINKAKKREVVINTYEVIADMDGNPNTPAEFDDSPHDDEELFFKADENATQVSTNSLSRRGDPFLPFQAVVWRVATFELLVTRSPGAKEADLRRVQVDKNKVLILNFIHQELHHGTERKVPVLDATNNNSNIELYHRTAFQGVDLDVCVYWPEGEYKVCHAMVKFASDDLSDEHGENGVISTDTAWDASAKADVFNKKIEKLTTNYWAPRWKVCHPNDLS
jgi:hypothetical protein